MPITFSGRAYGGRLIEGHRLLRAEMQERYLLPGPEEDLLMQTADLLFAGTTTAPARDFVASVLVKAKPDRIWLPCAGRFAVAACLVGLGYPKDRIHTSDISLFSSVIGYLADPAKSLEEPRWRCHRARSGPSRGLIPPRKRPPRR